MLVGNVFPSEAQPVRSGPHVGSFNPIYCLMIRLYMAKAVVLKQKQIAIAAEKGKFGENRLAW